MNKTSERLEKVFAAIDKIFDLEGTTEETLVQGGLTLKQARALILYANGTRMVDISREISESDNIYNAISAINTAVAKILRSLLLTKTVGEHRELLQAAFQRYMETEIDV